MKIENKVLTAESISTILTAVIFVVAGAFPIMITMGTSAGLGIRETSSIILWGNGVGAALSVYLSLKYKMPLFVVPSLTAVAIMIPLLQQFSLGEVIFGYIVTGIILFLLGAFKLVGKIAKYLPLPIVLGMVAGIYMSYGLDLIGAVQEIPLAGILILAAYFGISLVTGKIPRQAAALIMAVLASCFLLPHKAAPANMQIFVPPVGILPEIRLDIILYISLPLVIVAVSDLFKGYGVLKANGYDVPLDKIACACGLVSIVGAFGLGHTVSTAGPAIAIISGESAGEKSKRYIGSAIVCALTVLVGLFAGGIISLLQILPVQVINIICGLAMIGLLTSSLTTAFGNKKFELGALASFVVGLSHITIAGIGTPVWAIAIGVLVSLLTDRKVFSALTA